uniref:Ig-like domain-containing protein n=1 Tax=Chelydra serpentina TaxID=8475 RepID=A0A8C3SRL8_CHESE
CAVTRECSQGLRLPVNPGKRGAGPDSPPLHDKAITPTPGQAITPTPGPEARQSNNSASGTLAGALVSPGSGRVSPGLHTFQYTYGCQQRADGGAGGFRQYGYDGRDFLSYDTGTHTWVAPSKEAEITKGKMEGDRHLSQQQRDYLERKCGEWLQKYLGYGNETLQRRERPAVRVTGRDAPGGPTTLSCRAHGFYPRDIAVSWLRRGESREQETRRGGILPNGDGTYHAWATVEIDPRERGLYRCRVEHASLAQPLDTAWGEAGGVCGRGMKWGWGSQGDWPYSPPGNTLCSTPQVEKMREAAGQAGRVASGGGG